MPSYALRFLLATAAFSTVLLNDYLRTTLTVVLIRLITTSQHVVGDAQFLLFRCAVRHPELLWAYSARFPNARELAVVDHACCANTPRGGATLHRNHNYFEPNPAAIVCVVLPLACATNSSRKKFDFALYKTAMYAETICDSYDY